MKKKDNRMYGARIFRGKFIDYLMSIFSVIVFMIAIFFITSSLK